MKLQSYSSLHRLPNLTARGPGAVYYRPLVEIPHFVMERQRPLGLEARAERAWARQSRGAPRETPLDQGLPERLAGEHRTPRRGPGPAG